MTICGQQLMKDEGLDKKSIEEVGSSNAFSVVSIDPAEEINSDQQELF